MENPEGKKEVQTFNMKQMLLRNEKEVKPMGEMNPVEETKAKLKAVLNLAQKQYAIIVAKKVIRDLNADF